MAIEAPISKFKKNNLLIAIVVLLAFSGWLIYDGNFNPEFQEKNTVDGQPNSTLAFNQKAPPYLIGVAVLCGIYLLYLSKKKIIAEENKLILTSGKELPYDSIQAIDKTYFSNKGYFHITYKTSDGSEKTIKLSDRKYDNLGLVLDKLVSEIS